MSRTEGSGQSGRDDLARTRLVAAEADVVAATRRARLARIAAAPALRVRVAHRSRLMWGALVAAIAVVLVLAVASLILALGNRSSGQERADRRAVLEAAGAAVATMLTADPADASGYVDRVLAVTTGAAKARITGVRDALIAEVAAQSGPSVGQTVSSGLVDDPPADAESGTRVGVLVVADATNPALLGGQAPTDRDQVGSTQTGDLTGSRLTVAVTMQLVGSEWLVAQARSL
ncbi:hypothetical protein QSJ18_14130 [Gordonia sp. ABSL1-1]|uniref:hypothetical protein n=1 Tax=Gordonia sp. ABSL1-1 TaxID=3053923 RepID=UPI002572EF3C|nr:hypothetical protein [Gordonia sp. ABSL1-1]MDL9937888.1 hypothetical protein [Gordonia sp. ABSL1-1]